MKEQISFQYFKSPVGELKIGTFKNKLCICDWRYRKQRNKIDQRISRFLDSAWIENSNSLIEETLAQLMQYFKKERTEFELPFLLAGTEFQKQVWNQLMRIPFGKTLSYAKLADQMNNPLGIRAIASANGANAISILIPCHRIIGSDGSLVGYAGGIPAKKQLLQLEGALNSVQLSLL